MENKKLTVESLLRALVTISQETRRLRKMFERLTAGFGPDERAKYASQLRWFDKKIAEALIEGGISAKILDELGLALPEESAAYPDGIALYGLFPTRRLLDSVERLPLPGDRPAKKRH